MSSVLGFFTHPLPRLKSEYRSLAGRVLWLPLASITEVGQEEKLAIWLTRSTFPHGSQNHSEEKQSSLSY